MKNSRNFFNTLLLLFTVSSLFSQNSEKRRIDYVEAVKQYADAMLIKGRDNYGAVHSPLFVSALNRASMQIDPGLKSIEIPGVRSTDRSLTGANMIHDIDLLQILYQLSEITTDKKYANEADKALEFFFKNCQSQATGLMCWGEHLYWDFTTDNCGHSPGYDFHEATSWPFWDKSYQLAPEASWRFAISEWDNQISNKVTGDFSRHARYSKRETFSGFDFPRYAGQMIERWADAYQRPENGNQPRKEELLTAVHVLFKRMQENAALSKSGLLIAGRAAEGDHKNLVWLTSNLELARCLEEAAKIMEPEVAEKMVEFSLKQDLDFLSAPHKLDSAGGGFAVTLHAETGLPRTRSMNKPYTSTWASGYGYGTNAGTANDCVGRMKKLKSTNSVLARKYKNLILMAAGKYLDSQPDTSQLLKPNEFADVIECMLNGYEITNEFNYLERAVFFADMGIELFLNDKNPLPKATNKHLHYESITGGPSFMYQLLQLHLKMKKL